MCCENIQEGTTNCPGKLELAGKQESAKLGAGTGRVLLAKGVACPKAQVQDYLGSSGHYMDGGLFHLAG